MTDFSPLDFPLPERTGHETVEQRLAALEETVPRLLEALQYTLANLGAENFNAVALSRLVSPIHARIDGADGDIAQILSMLLVNKLNDLSHIDDKKLIHHFCEVNYADLLQFKSHPSFLAPPTFL